MPPLLKNKTENELSSRIIRFQKIKKRAQRFDMNYFSSVGVSPTPPAQSKELRKISLRLRVG